MLWIITKWKQNENSLGSLAPQTQRWSAICPVDGAIRVMWKKDGCKIIWRFITQILRMKGKMMKRKDKFEKT